MARVRSSSVPILGPSIKLCKGKLTNECGLGGLCIAHSIES